MAATAILLKSNFIAYLALITLVPFSESAGFTTDLIHRDSPLSPSYDPSYSPSQRLINALKRSVHRARRYNHHHSKLEKPEPDLISAGGEYLVKFSIGTPPVPIIAIADTGSDIVWTQCQPCLHCFNQSLPFFSPRHSTSYARVPCSSPTCSSLRQTQCSRTRRNCLYSTRYGDGSSSEGMIATENFTFASASASASSAAKTVVIPNIVFGCGFENSGIFSGVESGIVGLGGGNASLVRQLGSLAQGKFSYCLVPFKNYLNSSKLSFGDEAEVSGKGAVTTPLVVKAELETFYYVTMEAISVGKKRIEYRDDWGSVRTGNIVVDSGTTLTLLPASVFNEVAKAVKSGIKLKQIKDPSGECDLCFETKEEIRDFPAIVVHLRGGDVKWGYENAFVRTGDDSVCLAAKASMGIAIYGNFAQTNFLVGYDLVKKTVSFKPQHC